MRQINMRFLNKLLNNPYHLLTFSPFNLLTQKQLAY